MKDFCVELFFSLPERRGRTEAACESVGDRRARPPQKVQECRTEGQRRDSRGTSNLLLQFDVSPEDVPETTERGLCHRSPAVWAVQERL